MKYDLPPLSCLPAFEAAARKCSFTKAAEELCLTQAAISFQVRNLEEALSTKLFLRGHKTLELTPSGEALLHVVQNAFTTLAVGKTLITGVKPSNSVMVSAPVSFSGKWLVPRLHRLKETAPEISLLIDANDSILDMENGAVQLAIRYCSEPPVGLISLRLMEDVIIPVCSPQTTKLIDRNYQQNDLEGLTLLHDQMTDFSWRDWFKSVYEPGREIENEAAQAETLQDGINFSHTGNAIDAAVAGQGIALGRLPLVADDIETGRLVQPFREVSRSRYAYYLLRTPKSIGSSDVDVVSEWLISEASNTTAFLFSSSDA